MIGFRDPLARLDSLLRHPEQLLASTSHVFDETAFSATRAGCDCQLFGDRLNLDHRLAEFRFDSGKLGECRSGRNSGEGTANSFKAPLQLGQFHLRR